MVETLKPENAAQVLEAVQWALSEKRPLDIEGQGSKRGLGRPGASDLRLSLAGLSGVSLYEPEELVLSAGPGTTMAEIEGLLSQNRQQLAFEPPDLGALYGMQGASQSIGGILSANLAGPRRFKAGAARDHFLGFQAVTGRGEAVKSGGRVVKNVTGYDLPKLLAGSYGTLGVLTDVTIKVLPAPEKTWTVLVMGLDAAQATALLSEAAGSPHEVSGLAYLPAKVAARSAVGYVAGAAASVAAVRLEGPGPSVEYRANALRQQFAGRGAVEELHSHNSGTFWREIRDVAVLLPDREAAVWKLSVTPSAAPAIVAAIGEAIDAEAYYDWAGGLVWLTVPQTGDAGAALVRGALAGQGHATLVRASDEVRAAVPVFQPQPAPLAAVSRRVKEAFDPETVLNRGRMYAEL